MILAFWYISVEEEEENNNEKPSGRMTFPGPPQEKKASNRKWHSGCPLKKPINSMTILPCETSSRKGRSWTSSPEWGMPVSPNKKDLTLTLILPALYSLHQFKGPDLGWVFEMYWVVAEWDIGSVALLSHFAKCKNRKCENKKCEIFLLHFSII